jgi:hypothetical protein
MAPLTVHAEGPLTQKPHCKDACTGHGEGSGEGQPMGMEKQGSFPGFWSAGRVSSEMSESGDAGDKAAGALTSSRLSRLSAEAEASASGTKHPNVL